MKNLNEYHQPVNGQTILWDEHNRPYYQVSEGRIYLSKKGAYNYSINKH